MITRTNSSRVGHLLTLWPLSTTHRNQDGEEVREVQTEFLYYEAAAFMAMEHFNARNNTLLPDLSDLWQDCDFQIVMTVRDTRFEFFRAVKELTDVFSGKKSKATESLPFALLGSAMSGETQMLSIVGSSLGLPQITGTATSAALDSSPLFARTIPTNKGDADAIMMYLASINVKHIGILYILDAWGVSYNQALLQASDDYGIHVVLTTPYRGNLDSMEHSMRSLAGTKLSYFIGVLGQDEWRNVVRTAHKYGLMGKQGKTWYLAEITEMLGDNFELERQADADVANALHGTGILLLNVPPLAAFDQALADFLLERDTTRRDDLNRTMRDRFIDAHSEKGALFDSQNNNFTFYTPNPSLYQYLMYDAVMSLGLAACQTPGLFAFQEFYDQLLRTEFFGVTGHVIFDNTTGTRYGQSIEYEIVNLYLSEEESTPSKIRFHSERSIVVSGSEGTITEVKPFIFWDNTTLPPPALPPMENHNFNLIPKGVIIFGWCFSSLIILLSILCFAWTIVSREKYVVKASQPIFLCQICVGTMIFALAIFPLGMQESPDEVTMQDVEYHDLDMACMAVPWLLFVGYVVSFSALFSKTWRLNRLLQNSKGMQRVELRPRHVIGPFLALLAINLALLLAWNIVSPLRYHRILGEDSVDEFGRPTESYGICISTEGSIPSWKFGLPLAVVDSVGVFFAVYQLYLARDLPTEFSEASDMSVAMISFLETLMLGLPILVVVNEDPGPSFFLTAAMVNIIALGLLIPTFLPKFRKRNNTPRGPRAGPLSAAGANSTERDTAQRDQGLSESHQHVVRRRVA